MSICAKIGLSRSCKMDSVVGVWKEEGRRRKRARERERRRKGPCAPGPEAITPGSPQLEDSKRHAQGSNVSPLTTSRPSLRALSQSASASEARLGRVDVCPLMRTLPNTARTAAATIVKAAFRVLSLWVPLTMLSLATFSTTLHRKPSVLPSSNAIPEHHHPQRNANSPRQALWCFLLPLRSWPGHSRLSAIFKRLQAVSMKVPASQSWTTKSGGAKVSSAQCRNHTLSSYSTFAAHHSLHPSAPLVSRLSV